MPDIRFLDVAREEFLAAAQHYDSAAPGLGDEFIEEVERAVELIARFPDKQILCRPREMAGDRRAKRYAPRLADGPLPVYIYRLAINPLGFEERL